MQLKYEGGRSMFWKKRKSNSLELNESKTQLPLNLQEDLLNQDVKKDIKKDRTVEYLKQVNSLLKYVTELDYVKDMLIDVRQQSEMVDSIATTSEEMTATVEGISNFIQRSSEETNHTLELSNHSLDLINQSFIQIEETFEQSKNIQGIMNRVNTEAEKINEMVAIIKGVADQTNLLALNASIEAARAGESGRGFAVVAEEIKKLAENTKEQVDFIRQVVNNLTHEIQNTDEALEESNASFSKSKQQMEKAFSGMEKMKDGLHHISQTFMEISANIQEETAASQEMSSAIMLVNEKTKVIHTETDKTGMAFHAVSKVIDDIRTDILKTQPQLDLITQLEVCISDHLLWKWRVYNMILGYESLDASEIGTHHTCRLGQWCDHAEVENQDICKKISALEKPHEQLHKHAKEAVQAYNQGNKDRANELLEEMDQASADVVKYLGDIKRLHRRALKAKGE